MKKTTEEILSMSAYIMPGIVVGTSAKGILYKSPSEVLDFLCDYFNVPIEKVKERDKSRELVEVRQIFCLLMRTYTRMKLVDIADILGYKDHTTVIHAVSKIKDLIEVEPELQMVYMDIERELVF